MPGLKAFLFLNFLFWWLEGGICVQIEIIIIDCIMFAFAHAFEVMRVIFTAGGIIGVQYSVYSIRVMVFGVQCSVYSIQTLTFGKRFLLTHHVILKSKMMKNDEHICFQECRMCRTFYYIINCNALSPHRVINCNASSPHRVMNYNALSPHRVLNYNA